MNQVRMRRAQQQQKTQKIKIPLKTAAERFAGRVSERHTRAT